MRLKREVTHFVSREKVEGGETEGFLVDLALGMYRTGDVSNKSQ